MSILTLEIDSSLARAMEESARREHKPVDAWARDHLRLAAMETEAGANGYPPAWLKLFGSIDDASFEAPARTASRVIDSMNKA